MPIYEFKCLDCNSCVELLIMNSDETVEMKCQQCNSTEMERIMSRASFAVRGGGCASNANQFGSQTRTCSAGSCTTYNLPGPD